MKKALSVIRWKFVIPVVVLIAIVVGFFTLFFDPILAHVIEVVGNKVNGARVEVSGLKTTFAQGRLSIDRLQVTNRKDPMKNIVDAGPLVFQIEPGELLSKRVLIDDATLSGLRFNTARKTSGALPTRVVAKSEADETPGPAARLADKYKDRFKINLDGLKSQVKSRIQFDPKDLTLTKQADALKAQSTMLPDNWKKREAALNVDGRLKKAQADLDSLKATPTKGAEAVTAIPAALKKLESVKNDLATLKSDLDKAKNDTTSEIKTVRTGIAALPSAKEKDLNDLMGRLNLGFVEPQRLVEGLIGSAVLQRFETAMKYVEIARKQMPSKKEQDSLPPRPRAHGMDIRFPMPAAPPRFWLKKAALDGLYEDIRAVGSLSNVTSDPARVGRPLLADLAGAQGAQSFKARLNLDHTGDVAKDVIDINATGLDIKKLAGGSPLIDSLAAGSGAANIRIGVRGFHDLDGRIDMKIAGIKIDPARFLPLMGTDPSASDKGEALKANFLRNIAAGIEKMPEVTIGADLGGTWEEPTFNFTSNMVASLGNVIKSSVGSALQDQRKDVENRLDGVLNERTADVQKDVDGVQKQVNDRVAALEAQVQKKIDDATGLHLGGGTVPGVPGLKVPKLNKLFKH